MKKVLIVDDEPALLKIFQMEFGDQGELDVKTVTSGSDALDFLSGTTVDIIITDLTMPQMSGVELLSAIRKMAINIPCKIVISGLPIDIHIEELKMLGIQKYFEKPYRISEVVKFVRSNC